MLKKEKIMKALYYKAPGRVNASICEIPYPKCKDDEIIIKVMSCSICIGVEGDHDQNGSSISNYPVVPGHEFAGIVDDVGKGVRKFKPGDRVTADNTVSCGKCYYCQKGALLFCEDKKPLGCVQNGGMAEYVVVKEAKGYHIQDHVSFDEACLAEPIACCIHAMDQMQIKYGDEVLVLGAGPMGMILAQLAKNSNASHVVVVGSTKSKLDILNKIGIETILMDRNDYSIHEKAVLEKFPHGVDCLFDATGSEELVFSVPKLMKMGGRILGYGYYRGHNPELRFPFSEFWDRECTYLSTLSQTGDFDRAMDAIASGKVAADILKTADYRLEEYFEALDRNLNDRKVIKIIIHPNGEVEA